MLAFGLLCTSFAKGQDFLIQDNVPWPGSPPVSTSFLQSTPFPTLTTTPSQLDVGKGFDFKPTRAVFFGGNLGISQTTYTFGEYLKKWSFIGAWQKESTFKPIYYPGINYLVNYHRWGNYAAHFGLREEFTNSSGEEPPPGTKRNDAVITWAYEYGAAPNRLIFQTIRGVDPAAGFTDHVATEWATILSNGNIGSGISAPTAQLQMKPLGPALIPLMELLDNNGTSKFKFKKTGELILGGGTPLSSGTVPTVLEVLGNVKIRPNITYSLPSSLSENKNFHVVDKSNNDLFYVRDDGNSQFNGSLSVNSASTGLYIQSTSANAIPLLLSSYSGVPRQLFSVNDLGEVFIPQYASSGTDLNLKVNSSGKIIATTVPYTDNSSWEVGGNTFSGTSAHTLGSYSNNDVLVTAGNTIAFKVDGTSFTRRGCTEFNKSVSMGGMLSSPGWSLIMKPISVGGNMGTLKCLNTSGDEIFVVDNSSAYFGSSGIASFFGNAGFYNPVRILNTATIDNVLPGNASSDIGSVTKEFNDIWISGDVYLSGSGQFSDKRLKENIKPIEKTLDIIRELNPVVFNFKKKPGKTEYGFLAQELEVLLPKVVKIPKNDSDKYYVYYTALIPVLTKGIQEQQIIIEEQQVNIDLLKKKLDLILAGNSFKENKNIVSQKEIIIQLPLLFQNHPNPFNGYTFIDYFLPQNSLNAFLKVIDNNGKLIKAFPINKTGYGQIELDCTNLALGTYHYSLLVNNQIIDTKTMIIASTD